MNPYYSNLITTTDDLYPGLRKEDPTPFQILDNDTGEVLFEATATSDLSYENNLKVAYEPQEDGQFFSNSKQGTPFKLVVTAVVTPMLSKRTDTAESVGLLISDAKFVLQDLLKSKVILAIITQDYNYAPITLIGINYYQSANMPILMVDLTFQEARVANVTFQPLKENTLASPVNASTAPTGLVQTNTPDASSVKNGALNISPVGGINPATGGLII